MANEYLKRQPTSSGNSRRWTISFWMKNSDPTQGYTSIIGAGKLSPSNVYNEIFYNSSQIGLNLDNASASDNYNITANPLLRDSSSWMHIIVSFTDQGDNANTRLKFYINGAFVDHNTGTGLDVSETSFFNSVDYIQYIGSRAQQSAGTTTFDGQYFDVFLVDGQTLTPDVFGFYKDGDGYMSSGTVNSTDFKPGQWMPHSPTKIKKDINRRGGFGVNGFYLPMNDSSNPGADFHCDPNSIIKLKGEDLPQPRNGAPTTSDAFVSQLRQEEGTLGFDGVVRFDGSAQNRLTLPVSSDFAFGTGDFTVEMFVYHTDLTGQQTYFGDTYAATAGLYLYKTSTNQISTYDTAQRAVSGANVIKGGQWHHLAWTVSSGVLRQFVDGNKITETSYNGNYTTTEYFLGDTAGTSSGEFIGFMSNVRVVKGTALYTANFTPPTEPLTNVTNTKLLCCNSSTSATAATVAPGTITAVGGAFATRNELTGSIVLAVPGISTATGANLVTNGSFDSNVSGWTAVDATLTWNAGRAQTNRTGGSGYTAYQQITVVSGQRYTISGLIDSTGGGNRQDIRVLNNLATNGGSLLVNILGTDNEIVERSGSFTATGTTHYVYLVSDGGGTGFFDNIIVKQEDVPRDYSADIKGSGTNKTLTAAGNAGVGYDLGGYYGSAMTFDGSNDYLTAPNSTDYSFGTGDFTIEFWLYRDVTNTSECVMSVFENSSARRSWLIETRTNSALRFEWTSNGSSSSNITTANNSVPGDQWVHICCENYNNVATVYVNGVAAGINNNTGTIYNNTQDPLRIGVLNAATDQDFNGQIQDVRIYKGVAKYKGGFDVPKPYTPVGIEAFRTTADTCKNNFATLNPLYLFGNTNTSWSSNITLSNGSLTAAWTSGSGSNQHVRSSFAMLSGKWYFETRMNAISGGDVGVAFENHINDSVGWGSDQLGFSYRTDGQKQNNTSASSYGSSYVAGDIIGCAYDADAKSITFYKNGTSQGVAFSGISIDQPAYFAVGKASSGATQNSSVNFGQNPTFSGQVTAGTNADGNGKGLFKYAPPTGFLALCSDNLPTPAIADPGKHFKTVLYTGMGTNGTDGSQSIRKVGFQPDLVWVKKRGAAGDHKFIDSVRGVAWVLESNTTDVEGNENNNFTGFNSDGFDLGANNAGAWNENGYGYVAWCWKAGGAAVSNSDGSITSQVSANQTAGFSIVSYTGNYTAGATIGHGLGKKPSMMIVKERTGASGWFVYHKDLGATKFLSLHDVTAAGTETGNTACWYATEPNTSVFTVGQNGATNENNRPIIAYCWTEIEGYSKFGSYSGNQNADGPFIYCGFKPAWVLIKSTTLNPSAWILVDSSRDPVNPCTNKLFPDYSGGENVSSPSGATSSTNHIDLLSNGFKLRSNNSWTNYNSNTYIFMAFAESPFQTANAK